MILIVEMCKVPVSPKKMAFEKEDYYHTAPKCKKCPYGRNQFCVGVCWKEIYDTRRRNNKSTGDING